MRYYVTADVHGYYTQLNNALTDAGFFTDPGPHKLIILGDLFDRGSEAAAMQDFVLQLMKEDLIIPIKGNHEDLYVSLVTDDEGKAYIHHVHNGTFDTALQLTGFDRVMARIRHWDFAAAGRRSPYFQKIIPKMLEYYETKHYIFVHGWIPCIYERGDYSCYSDWRNAPKDEWDKARWFNGMDAAETSMEEKTIVCGHWHASYGHVQFEHKGSEFGPDADFSPYYGDRIIAMDACTAESGKVNVLVLED